MQTTTESTLIAVRDEKGKLIAVMERLPKGFEVFKVSEATVKDVETLFTVKQSKSDIPLFEGTQEALDRLTIRSKK